MLEKPTKQLTVLPSAGSTKTADLKFELGGYYTKDGLFGIVTASITEGDVNGDSTVNAADIVGVVNFIMSNPSEQFNAEAADVNHDGTVNAADIVALVNIIMGV